MESSALVAQQTVPIEGKPIKISLLAFLVMGVYAVMWSRKRKARRQLKRRERKKRSKLR